MKKLLILIICIFSQLQCMGQENSFKVFLDKRHSYAPNVDFLLVEHSAEQWDVLQDVLDHNEYDIILLEGVEAGEKVSDKKQFTSLGGTHESFVEFTDELIVYGWDNLQVMGSKSEIFQKKLDNFTNETEDSYTRYIHSDYMGIRERNQSLINTIELFKTKKMLVVLGAAHYFSIRYKNLYSESILVLAEDKDPQYPLTNYLMEVFHRILIQGNLEVSIPHE
jgi:hypothetical protein